MQAIEQLKSTASATALQAQLAPIANAVGLKDDAEATAILSAVTTLAATAGKHQDEVITALQGELATLGAEVKTLRDGGARKAAEAAIDAGTVGVKPLPGPLLAGHVVDPRRGRDRTRRATQARPVRRAHTPPAQRTGQTQPR